MGSPFDILTGAAGIVQSIGQFNQAKSNARTLAKEAKITAENRAQEIRSLAATQRVSYLNSGLEMEGTPAAVIADTHQIGRDDVAAIKSSYKKQIKNLMTQARANLLSGLLTSSAQIGSGVMSIAGAAGGGG